MPVSAGFSGEDATMIAGAGAGAGGSQKAESVVSGSERSQLRQLRCNVVPSGSPQTDVVLLAQVPKVR